MYFHLKDKEMYYKGIFFDIYFNESRNWRGFGFSVTVFVATVILWKILRRFTTVQNVLSLEIVTFGEVHCQNIRNCFVSS